VEHALHFFTDFGVSGQLVEREEVFLEVEVDIGLEVGKPDWVLEAVVLYLCDVASALDEDVPVEIVYNVVQLLVHDLLHVHLDLRLKVVEPVEEGPDVSLERPACVRSSQPFQQFLKGVPFLELSHVDHAPVVNEGLHDLEVGDQVEEVWLDLDLLVAAALFLESFVGGLVVSDESLDHGGVDVESDIAVRVVLHLLEDPHLVVFEGLSVAVDQEPEEVQQLRAVVAGEWLTVNSVADFLDELADVDLVEEEGFVVVVHFLEEVDTADVLL
jgi:hypothetical protein